MLNVWRLPSVESENTVLVRSFQKVLIRETLR